MIALLNFAALPPEINSARMYSGAGSAPLLAAASAWKGLAAELRVTELLYTSVLMALTSEEWHGWAAKAMVAAATPYVAWLSIAAGQAEQTALQVEDAVARYEAAFADTVSPQAIAANRAQLVTLIATNVLDLNAPKIAAIEAQYHEMWSQDAAVMYGYASSSAAAATQLNPFTEPQQTTDLTGLAAQSAAVAQASGEAAGSQQLTLSQLVAAIPNALQGLASSAPLQQSVPLSSLVTGDILSWLKTLWDEWGPNADIWNTLASSGFLLPSNIVSPFLGLLSGAAVANTVAADETLETGISGVADTIRAPLGSTGGLMAASAGNASLLGKLAVPPSWTAVAPPTSPLGSALGGTPMVAPPPAMAAGMPGVPLGSTVGQGFGRAVPQYGFRPTFVARPPAAG